MQATQQSLSNRERFLAVMEYEPVDRVPNWEAGVWGQTIDRWVAEGLQFYDYHWNWFTGEDALGLDPREFIVLNTGMMPPFEHKVLERTEDYEIIQHETGVVTKALIAGMSHGTRSCMDQYLRFPVETVEDFRALKKRYIATYLNRQSIGWRELMLPRWKQRDHVLVLGQNCATLGFYWRAREWMGTEGLSMAWYLQPQLIEEMMEFTADFNIEVCRPFLEAGICPDYIMISEDMAMKTGPLLSPELYRQYIAPHMKRMVEFFKSHGVRYVMVDTDGNSEPLFPALLDVGVDGVWPIERAAEDMDPIALRKKYGRSLRLTGCVDKRELAKDRAAIDAHLRTLVPLIEEGGFIPTVDHTVPPDVPLDNFMYYMERKRALLEGRL